MRNLFSLIMLFSMVGFSQASVFGDHNRAVGVAEKYPQQMSVARFSGAVIDGVSCEWENAGKFALKTDRGNMNISSYSVAPTAIKISCEGKRAFYVFSLDSQYLKGSSSDDAVGVWFGKTKDRDGCEGYTGCDKVHVIHTYQNAEVEAEAGLQEW